LSSGIVGARDVTIRYDPNSIGCEVIGSQETRRDGQLAVENMPMWSGGRAGMRSKHGVHGVRLTIKPDSWDRWSASNRGEECSVASALY